LLKVVDLVFFVYLLTIFFLFNFTPYPFPRSGVLALFYNASNGFRCCCRGLYPAAPDPMRILAYDWLLDHIQVVHANHIPRILLAVDCLHCEGTAILYLAKQRGMLVDLKYLFVPAATGVFQCDPRFVSRVRDWYVTLKNEPDDEDPHFLSEEDRAKYYELKEFFEKSASFSKVGEVGFPDDDTSMVVYRRVLNAPKVPTPTP